MKVWFSQSKSTSDRHIIWEKRKLLAFKMFREGV